MDQLHFVMVHCRVRCEWRQFPPTYRIYVNHEMFTERTWIWDDNQLDDCLQILAPEGKYKITYRLVDPHDAKIFTSDWRVSLGPAVINQHADLRIGERPPPGSARDSITATG
jgi:hypothetical protein